jgi:heavy metal sensor kinase
MRKRSIRFRLTVWYAVALSLGLGLFSCLIWLSLRERLVSELDHDLAGRSARFEEYLLRVSQRIQGDRLKHELAEFCQALPPGSSVDVTGTSGFQFHYPAVALSPSVRLRTSERHVAAGAQEFKVNMGLPMEAAAHTLQLLRLLLFSLMPVAILVACAGGAWLIGRALKPIQDLTAAASSIGIGNLSERLPLPATGDELDRLAGVLNGMLARLETAVKRLSQFAADASHELRTPLAVIRTTAELALRRARPSEAYRTALGEIAAESERMTQLVEDLLSLARSGTEAVQMPRAVLDLRALVDGVSNELRPLAEARGVGIQTRLGEDAAFISGNRPALRRLFVILLDNALKYSPEGGEVLLRLSRERNDVGSRVSVSIEDSGEGISADDLPHIFERFYRGDPARTRRNGAGLGLAIARSIAQAHGAEIEVESTEGKGAEFSVRLPLSLPGTL